MKAPHDPSNRAVSSDRETKRLMASMALQRLVFCHEYDTVESAKQLMKEHRLESIPVVDREGRLIGSYAESNEG
jgi:Mg/Co/Ni transporter MgtE